MSNEYVPSQPCVTMQSSIHTPLQTNLNSHRSNNAQTQEQEEASSAEESAPEPQKQQQVTRKNKKKQAVQKRPPPEYYDDDDDEDDEPVQMAPRPKGRRMVPVHQSRIADRPPKVGEKDSSLKIKIELDLEGEIKHPSCLTWQLCPADYHAQCS